MDASLILSQVLKYKWIILFYLALVLLFYLGRRNVIVQAKIIFLYRTIIGIPFIERFATRHREIVKMFGYIGMGIGFIGMAVIAVLLIFSFIWLFTRPEQPPGVSPVYPGMELPGFGVLSFWDFLISIFVIAVIHEFSHGIVAYAHAIKVKWTGIVLFGPILGAFVEPDENKLTRSDDITQYSVYAAGAFSNMILGILAAVLVFQLLVPLQQSMVEPAGFIFTQYSGKGNPAEAAGLAKGTAITSIDNITIKSGADFVNFMQCTKANQTIKIGTAAGSVPVKLGNHPDRPGSGFMGISFEGANNDYKVKSDSSTLLYAILMRLMTFFRWLSLLSIGIGLANLLPLPIVDGGRMVQVFLKRLYGGEKGNKRYTRLSMFFLVLLLLNLFIPFVRWIFGN